METQSQNVTQNAQVTKFESQEKASSTPFTEFYSLLDQGKLEEAILLLEKIAPCWEKASLLGCYYGQLGNFSKAEDAFLEALRHDPENSETMYNLAVLYNDFFQPCEAKKYMELYLQKEPDDCTSLFIYATMLLDLDLIDEAYEVFKKVYKIDSTNAYAIAGLAGILHEKKRPKVALRLLKKAALINPADPELLFLLSSVAREAGEEIISFEAREMLQLIDPTLCTELDKRTGRQSWL